MSSSANQTTSRPTAMVRDSSKPLNTNVNKSKKESDHSKEAEKKRSQHGTDVNKDRFPTLTLPNSKSNPNRTLDSASNRQRKAGVRSPVQLPPATTKGARGSGVSGAEALQSEHAYSSVSPKMSPLLNALSSQQQLPKQSSLYGSLTKAAPVFTNTETRVAKQPDLKSSALWRRATQIAKPKDPPPPSPFTTARRRHTTGNPVLGEYAKSAPGNPAGLGNKTAPRNLSSISPLQIPMVTVTGGQDSDSSISGFSHSSFFGGIGSGGNRRSDAKKDGETAKQPVKRDVAAGRADEMAPPTSGLEGSLDIPSVETPSGMDEWSSSSSSSGVAKESTKAYTVGSPLRSSLVNGRAVGSPRGSAITSSAQFSRGARGEHAEVDLMPLTDVPLHSFDANDIYDDDDLHSNGGFPTRAGLHLGADDDDENGDRGSNPGGGGMGMGIGIGSSNGVNESGHNGLATFFNRPKECHHCQSSAVAYSCEQCTSFYLCENCRFDEDVLDHHERSHRIVPLHETHCNMSRTFGGSSSLQTMDGISSLFYDPCSMCQKVIDDAEPVYRCESCDFIVCESCHGTRKIDHPHELRRFQRKARNGSVTEATLFNKSRTNDGNKIINDYVVVRLLGQGSFAKVKLVQSIRTRKLYALKILRKTRHSQSNLMLRGRVKQNDDDLLREIAVMKFVDHPNIVKLAEVIDDVEAGKLYVIMEYCAKGPVHVLGDPVRSLSCVRSHGLGILAGLLHLHSEFLYHRDVKPANCLVDEHDVVKIADFGTCSSRIRTSAADGTPAFSCPEQIRGEEVSGEVADSWAYALTLYQMAYGLLPCNGMGPREYRELLLKDEPIPVPPPEALKNSAAAEATNDPSFTDLLVKMLRKDMKHRVLLSAAASHSFFRLDSDAVKRLCYPSISLDNSASGSQHSHKAGARIGIGLSGSGCGGAGTSSVPLGSRDRRVGSVSQNMKNLSPTKFPPSAYGTLNDAAGSPLCSTSTSFPSQPNNGGSAHAFRRNYVSNGGTSANPTSGDGSRQAHNPVSARHAQLYQKALLEVRRGKNLTEAFHGVKSLRRVRRKDVKNADSNAATDRDDVSSSLQPGNSQSFGDDVVSLTAVNAGPNGSTSAVPVLVRPLRYPQTSGRSPVSAEAGGAKLPESQQRVPEPYLSDAAFDMATILDRISQQRSDNSGTLELVRLRMPSVPTSANDVAGITVNLRFSMNSLISVASVKFSQFAFLKDVAITCNQLRRFPEEILKAPRLLRLDLSHNSITSIPASVVKARFLERLNLHANSIRAVGVDSRTRTSVLAAPSLRHVRLSSNPMEMLPQNLESTQGIELVLDANPTVMKEWYSLVDRNTQSGRAPPAVVIWDDYFPVRIPGCAYDVWIASGDLSLYRAHTLKACETPFVVLLSAADSRFPRGGVMTSAQLAEHLDAEGAQAAPVSSEYTALRPQLRPLPPIVSKESRAFVKSFFFVSDDVDDPVGGYNALFDYLLGILTQQKGAFAEKGVRIGEDTAVVVPLNGSNPKLASPLATTPSRNRKGATSSSVNHHGASGGNEEHGRLRPTSGKGLMLVLMNTSALKDARELSVAALSDALCKMSSNDSADQLKVMFNAIMEAMRSLYA